MTALGVLWPCLRYCNVAERVWPARGKGNSRARRRDSISTDRCETGRGLLPLILLGCRVHDNESCPGLALNTGLAVMLRREDMSGLKPVPTHLRAGRMAMGGSCRQKPMDADSRIDSIESSRRRVDRHVVLPFATPLRQPHPVTANRTPVKSCRRMKGVVGNDAPNACGRSLGTSSRTSGGWAGEKRWVKRDAQPHRINLALNFCHWTTSENRSCSA